MSIRHSVDLHGNEYRIGSRISDGTTNWQILEIPIRASTFVAFLNEIGHCEEGQGAHFINTVNYDKYVEKFEKWTVRPGAGEHPITLVSHLAAEAFAQHHSLHLISRRLWTQIVANVDRDALPSQDSINIEETNHGPIGCSDMPTSPLGTRGLIGNVSFWGEADDASYAACFGVGWNKSRLNIDSKMAKRRWRRTTSVSTGIRLALKVAEPL